MSASVYIIVSANHVELFYIFGAFQTDFDTTAALVATQGVYFERIRDTLETFLLVIPDCSALAEVGASF